MADPQQPQPQEMNIVHAGALNLPPGFCFHPSDYEIVNHYLTNKVCNKDFTCTTIGEVDLNKIEPWDLPRMAKWGEKEWYFFYQKDRKYPAGIRANRATEAGYWKATGKDKEVYKPTEGEGVVLLIGMKKTLVFYTGRAPRGEKTNWVMHEYRLEGSGRITGPTSASSSAANAATMKASSSASKDEWVVCRVFDKTTRIKKRTALAYKVAMASAEIDQTQNNIPAIPIPMPMQFPILTDFAVDPVAPYYPNSNADVGMPPMMPPMAGIGGANELQINDALFTNSMATPPPMNFYHQKGMGASAGQMGMGAVAQMDIGVAGIGGFNVDRPKSSPALVALVSQNDVQANAAEISSMVSMIGAVVSAMDGIWKYKY